MNIEDVLNKYSKKEALNRLSKLHVDIKVKDENDQEITDELGKAIAQTLLKSSMAGCRAVYEYFKVEDKGTKH